MTIQPFTHASPEARSPLAHDREAYFLAAYAILIRDTNAAVTIMALCDRLKVTKGSFYHHFSDMGSFLTAFAARWKLWMLDRLDSYEDVGDPWLRLEAMTNHQMALMTGAEPKIRAWAHTNQAFADALYEVQLRGERLGNQTVAAVVGDPQLGEVLSRMLITFAVGLQQGTDTVDAARLLRLGSVWYQRCLGIESEIRSGPEGPRIRFLGSGPTLPVPASCAIPLITEFRASMNYQTFGHGWRAPRDDGRPNARTDYYAAALKILEDQGHESLTVGNLCEVLSVSKGSFRYHFSGILEFLDKFVKYHENTETGRIDLLISDPDPIRSLTDAHAEWLRKPQGLDSAWRAWSWVNPMVAKAKRRLDQRNLWFFETSLRATGLAQHDAQLLACMAISLEIGLQQLPSRPNDTAQLVNEWLHKVLRVPIHVDAEDGRPLLRCENR